MHGLDTGPVAYPIARDQDGELVIAATLERATLPPQASFRCIRCARRVRPILGDIRRHHFRHDHDGPCAGEGGEGEGLLHRMAKTIIATVYCEQLRCGRPYHLVRVAPESCALSVAGAVATCSRRGTVLETIDLTKAYDRIEEEQQDGAHRPDLLLSSSADPARRCWIEIVVSNAPTVGKLARGVPLVVIRVATLADLDRLAFPRLVQGSETGIALANWSAPTTVCLCPRDLLVVTPRPPFASRTSVPPREQALPARWPARPVTSLARALQPVAGIPAPSEVQCRDLAERSNTLPYYEARRANDELPVVAALAALGDGYRVDATPDCLLCTHAKWYLGVEYGFQRRIYCQRRSSAVSSDAATDCPDFDFDAITPP